jgi:hypothetical protein
MPRYIKKGKSRQAKPMRRIFQCISRACSTALLAGYLLTCICNRSHKIESIQQPTTVDKSRRMCEQKEPPRYRETQEAKDGSQQKTLLADEWTSWTPLPSDFTPSSMDVIVGTGREPRNHQGNALFKEMLKLYISRYSNVDRKLEKTLIISEIVAAVQEQSPTGSGFVKKVQGQWYAVDDHQSREKVSQGLRNILHDQYRSSARSKKRKRGLVCAEMQKSVDEMMDTKRSFLSQRMEKLSSELLKRGKDATEDDVEALFTQTNLAILEGLKKTEETIPAPPPGRASLP